MLSVISRTVVMYILIIFVLRIMGKKNLGEFTPSDFVSTILISNLTSIVIEEPHIPLGHTVSSILIIMCLEVIVSVLVKKNKTFCRITQGKSMVLIQNGVINQKTMEALRYSVNDVIEAMRSKDVFYLEEVCLAVVETNGTVNIYKDPDINTKIKKDTIPPLPVICDGSFYEDNIVTVNSSMGKLNKILEKSNINSENILLMTMDGAGKYNITVKEQ